MRYDLTDFEWSVIEPLLPMDRRGPKPKNNRQVLNGIFWVLRAGAGDVEKKSAYENKIAYAPTVTAQPEKRPCKSYEDRYKVNFKKELDHEAAHVYDVPALHLLRRDGRGRAGDRCHRS
jgi:hypothetical protein